MANHGSIINSIRGNYYCRARASFGALIVSFAMPVLATDLQPAIADFNNYHFAQAKPLFEAAVKDSGKKMMLCTI